MSGEKMAYGMRAYLGKKALIMLFWPIFFAIFGV